MPLRVNEDRIKEISITTGTGNFTLAGAVSGFRPFSAVMTNTQRCPYVIEGVSGEWETGMGQWTTGNILIREKVDRSSNGDALVNFSAGNKFVFLTHSATRHPENVRLGFIGDSSQVQQSLGGVPWPERIVQLIHNTGYQDVGMKNLAYNGHTAFRVSTQTTHGANTILTEMVSWKPHMVFVALGFNDAVGNGDGRTLAQLKTDFDTLLDGIKANVPDSLIYYISEKGYDSNNFVSSNLKNKGIFYTMEQNTTGFLANTFNSDMLENTISAPLQTKYQNWIDLDTYVKTRPNVTDWVEFNGFKAARLGLTTPDLGHWNDRGHQWMAASILKQLKAKSSFTTIFPRLTNHIVNLWQDPDDMFNFYLRAVGDGYVTANGIGAWSNTGLNSEGQQRFYGQNYAISPGEWYLPYKTRFTIQPLTGIVTTSYDIDGYISARINGGPPNEAVFISINGGAFSPFGTNTNSCGDWADGSTASAIGLPAGTYIWRWKVANEVYGPVTITINRKTTPKTYLANVSGPAWGQKAGLGYKLDGNSIFTDTSTAAAGSATYNYAHIIEGPVLAATNANISNPIFFFEAATIAFTPPTPAANIGILKAYSHIDTGRSKYYGDIEMGSAAIQQARGVSVISNNIVSFNQGGNYYHVLGTNTITLIANTGWLPGATIMLHFEAAAVLKHNQATAGVNVGVLLADANDFTAVANTTVELVYDDLDLKWKEVQRSNIVYRSPIYMVSQGAPGTAEPQVPSANVLLLYTRNYANRMLPKFLGPTGTDMPLGLHEGFARVAFLGPNSTTNMTCTNFSTPIVVSNAVVHPAQTTGSYKNQARRFTLASAGAAGSLASLRLTTTECWMGNAAGLGGFFLVMRFALTAMVSGQRGFFGLSDVLTAPTNVDPTTSTAPGKIGLAFALNSGNLKFVYNVTGTAPTSIDLGALFTVDTSNTYELMLYCPPNSTTIGYRVTNLQTGSNVANTISTNIPTNTTFLSPVMWMTNQAATPGVSFDVLKWHLESDS